MRRRFAWLPPAFVLLTGCGHPPETYTLPEQVTDFAVLYSNNCAGCHGRDGRLGAARPLNDPLYLAVISKEQSRIGDVIANGVPGTAMPGFAEKSGGTLTDRQIAILVDQIEARWSRPRDYVGVTLPPYSADLGDAIRGEQVFGNYCSKCHGKDGMGATSGGPTGGSVVDPTLLALMSNQSIRTTVIAGRADLGCPDWKSDSPEHVMTPQDISDVVAWLAAHRTPTPISAVRGTSTP